jgi:hypothetical protein
MARLRSTPGCRDAINERYNGKEKRFSARFICAGQIQH